MPVDGINPSQYRDPLYRVLTAQAMNIARIDTGVVVNALTAEGPFTLVGPTPDLVRLHDTPLRIMGLRGDLQRVITLAPALDQPAGRIAGRSDRDISYVVAFAVRLTHAEQAQDKEEKGVDNLLGRKMEALSSDFKMVFADDFNLITPQCPHGLVDDHEFTIEWDLDVNYPQGVFVATCTASLSEYR